MFGLPRLRTCCEKLHACESTHFALLAKVRCRNWTRTHIETLFGPVSISSQYSQLSCWLIMSALRRHHTDVALGACVRPRNAPPGPDAALSHRIIAVSAVLADPTRLSRILRFLEHGTGLPMLIKHYIELKGRFAAFNADPEFNEALDGLVYVRSRGIPAKLRERLRAGGRTGQTE